MKRRFFGDSYDVVKQSLLRWLGGMGEWVAHPMYTEPVTTDEAFAFGRFLGVELVSIERFTNESNRHHYLASARSRREHLFLDPDKGLRMETRRGVRAPAYLFAGELIELVRARPDSLTLVFDQCLPRGGEVKALQHKMSVLLEADLYTLAYTSHASFILAAADRGLISRAHTTLLEQSRLPPSRIIVGPQA